MSLQIVVNTARELEDALDHVIDVSEVNSTIKGLVDWSWYRFSTLNVLIRDGASGITSASLARGLLEEAAYWDWRAATGADTYWIAGQAVEELKSLVDRANELEDDVWTEWLLPPGSSFFSPGTVNPPRSTVEAVARMGHGFPVEYFGALPVNQLDAVYQLLNALSHGNLLASGAVAADSGWAGSPELSALLLHIGGAACVLVAIGGLELSSQAATQLTQRASALANAATLVHGLHGSPVSVKGRAARASKGDPFSKKSSISAMPGPPSSALAAGQDFIDAAVSLVRNHSGSIFVNDAISQLAGQAFQSAVAQLEIAKGVLDGQMGLALLPYAARPIMEEAARWSWLVKGLEHGNVEFRERVHSLIGDGSRRVLNIEQAFARRSKGNAATAKRLLGRAVWLHDIADAAGTSHAELPNDYLGAGYRGWGDGDWATPSYGVLSQFVHVTPLALLHLKPGPWHSLSAPVFCVALDALSRGFVLLLQQVLPLAGVPYHAIEDDLIRVTAMAAKVRTVTSEYHFIG